MYKPVSQDARAFAAKLYPQQSSFFRVIESGEADHFNSVQAFAQFESLIRSRVLEEAAGVLRKAEEALRPFAGIADVGKRGGEFVIASAIYADMTGRLCAPRQSHWHWSDFERVRDAMDAIRKLSDPIVDDPAKEPAE